MSGWLALNASTTCFSTATCSGASPPPRQQYQRISVWPGAAVEPPMAIGVFAGADASPEAPASWDAGAEAGAEAAPPLSLLTGAVVGLLPPHAAATSASTAMATVVLDARIAPPRERGWVPPDRRRGSRGAAGPAARFMACGEPPPRCRVAR